MEKNKLKIYRKRIIPPQCILLKDDIIVEANDDVIITKWQTLNPKTAFSHGCSCYFLKEGIKVSKFYKHDNYLLYWYCDIVSYAFNDLSAFKVPCKKNNKENTDNDIQNNDIQNNDIPNDNIADEDILIVTDLLADVIIYPDGRVKVVDLDELADALEQKLITNEQMCTCLRQLNNLLTTIDRDKFDKLQAPLEILKL